MFASMHGRPIWIIASRPIGGPLAIASAQISVFPDT
jgi:hypothetical protein